jgi:hypothetical protein
MATNQLRQLNRREIPVRVREVARDDHGMSDLDLPGAGASDPGEPVPARQIRARYTTGTITVYQAYRAEIARPALAAGRFVPPFERDRMTWIKPSFQWMMYRSGWATKPGQEYVLAVEITRAGFEWALGHACLSHYERGRHTDRADWSRQLKTAPVRVQWDPERDHRLGALTYRSLQVGLSREAVRRYADEWIVSLTDVTPLAHAIRDRIRAGDTAGAARSAPDERPYPISDTIAAVIGAA